MAKSQKRSNREIRKPKSDKPKTPPVAPGTSGLAMVFAADDRKKKK